jgi:protein TonB
MGPHILPAEPDDRYRNRPPIYPYAAAQRGEHGEVRLIIHVSANGLAAGADIAESSGIPALDQAALDAVRRWRFKPALRDGQAIPSDMPIRFVFEAN